MAPTAMNTIAVVVVPPSPALPESVVLSGFESEPRLLSESDVKAGRVEKAGKEMLADGCNVGDAESKKAEYVKGTESQPTCRVFPPS